MDNTYLATQWRKKIERSRKGWRRISNAMLPHCVIEFHIIHGGQLYSGRCHGRHLLDQDASTPGTLAYVIQRRDLMTEGVFRRAQNQHGTFGFVKRPPPWA